MWVYRLPFTLEHGTEKQGSVAELRRVVAEFLLLTRSPAIRQFAPQNGLIYCMSCHYQGQDFSTVSFSESTHRNREYIIQNILDQNRRGVQNLNHKIANEITDQKRQLLVTAIKNVYVAPQSMWLDAICLSWLDTLPFKAVYDRFMTLLCLERLS